MDVREFLFGVVGRRGGASDGQMEYEKGVGSCGTNLHISTSIDAFYHQCSTRVGDFDVVHETLGTRVFDSDQSIDAK